MQEKIAVSILCITYNQKEYLKSALDGCVHQETDFAFEIIVHDDASTDGTTEIIKEYAEKYPALIRPLYEEENQYSKGNSIAKIMFPEIRGRYVAFCEGDDCWCDVHKLQKQVNIMRGHPSAVACVHNAWVLDCLTGKKTKFSIKEGDGVLSTEDIIQWGNRGYATASLLMKRDYFFIPAEFQMTNVGDYPRAVYMSLQGDIYYLKDCMSVYRFNSSGSWTQKLANDLEEYRSHIQDMRDMLQYVNKYSGGRYQQAIARKIYINNYGLVYREIISGSRKADYLTAWNELSTFDKIKVSLLAHLRRML